MQALFAKLLIVYDVIPRFFFANDAGDVDRDYPSLFLVPLRRFEAIVASGPPSGPPDSSGVNTKVTSFSCIDLMHPLLRVSTLNHY